MNIFSTKITQYSVVPAKWKLSTVAGSSLVSSLLYLDASVLTILTLTGCFKLDNATGLVAVSVLEIILTVLSIFVTIIATHISDYVQGYCADRLKKIYEFNPWLQNKSKISDVLNRTEKNKKKTKIIKRLILFMFFLYFCTSVFYCIRSESTALQVLALGFGLISTFLSVILALTSSVSCFAFGDYMQTLLEVLDSGLDTLFSETNSRRISDSQPW